MIESKQPLGKLRTPKGGPLYTFWQEASLLGPHPEGREASPFVLRFRG